MKRMRVNAMRITDNQFSVTDVHLMARVLNEMFLLGGNDNLTN